MTQDKSTSVPGSAASPSTSLPLPDPFQMWRQAITHLEQQANALGNQSMRSPEFTKAMHQLSLGALQWQVILEEMLTRYFKVWNLPSRKDVEALAEALRAIDEKLDRLLPAAEHMQAPRPARTRQPPSANATGALLEPAPDSTVSPTTTKRSAAARKSAAARTPEER